MNDSHYFVRFMRAISSLHQLDASYIIGERQKSTTQLFQNRYLMVTNHFILDQLKPYEKRAMPKRNIWSHNMI